MVARGIHWHIVIIREPPVIVIFLIVTLCFVALASSWTYLPPKTGERVRQLRDVSIGVAGATVAPAFQPPFQLTHIHSPLSTLGYSSTNGCQQVVLASSLHRRHTHRAYCAIAATGGAAL